MLCIPNFGKAQNFGLLADGGFSYRLFVVNDSISSELEEYQKNKKKGYNFSIEPVWYSENNGFGIKYNIFLSKMSADSIKVSSIERMSISEDIKIHYLGLQYHKIIVFALSDISLNASAGVGALFYRNKKTEYKIKQTYLKGRTYALNASLKIEYALHPKLILFAGAGIFIANIKEAMENEITVFYNPGESLTRLDLNIGVRINLY